MSDTSTIYRYLHTFLTLSETLSFSLTAKSLKIAQPAVTRQIKLLEEILGVTLFIRNRQTVTLTEEGKLFLLRVAPFARSLEESLQELHNKSHNLSGSIHIGSLREFGDHILTPHIIQFWRQFPEIRCHIHYLKSFEIEEQIRNGALDFGIVAAADWPEGIRGYEIYTEDSVLVTSAAHKGTADQLENTEFIAYREGDPLLTAYLKKLHPRLSEAKIRIAFTVNSQTSMINALEKSQAFAVLPMLSVQQQIAAGKLRFASDKKMTSKLYLIMREDPLMEKRKQLFLQHLLTLKKRK